MIVILSFLLVLRLYMPTAILFFPSAGKLFGEWYADIESYKGYLHTYNLAVPWICCPSHLLTSLVIVLLYFLGTKKLLMENSPLVPITNDQLFQSLTQLFNFHSGKVFQGTILLLLDSNCFSKHCMIDKFRILLFLILLSYCWG